MAVYQAAMVLLKNPLIPIGRGLCYNRTTKEVTSVYAIAALAECIGACLVVSAIAWLRHLSGAPPLVHDFAARYITPVLMFVAAVSSSWYAVDAQQHGEFHPESDAAVAGLALLLGIVLSGELVWLVVEVRRFRERRGRQKQASWRL
jgi:hypothetical protein